MYLGRLAPVKGVENLLQAMARLGPDVSLKIYGTGDADYVRRLKALAQTLGITERAVFMGHVDGEAKSQAFFEADVCVVPSYSENFCIVVAEALVHGVPVIVSDRLAWEKVEEVGCGLVAPNDSESLARAMQKISKMELAVMGESGRRWIESEYACPKIALQFKSLYESVIACK
ncbi:hypothetical protein MIT9_P1840 [Methylomarinovum caldicuralii]|uniref:Glycosyl transferase family 1 domain-containing protein n=2 Tax=Methylomarinovum caldicuralii TaxID=438856 RepID=A0AAU9C564_9GAMM|nr:hypothetical protein MIT9_P1840 [Methylomarinovum caldicuralii]